MYKLNDFYVPKTAEELRGWLTKRYPEDKAKYRKMKKKQLYAIYYNIRRNHG